mmetsp:Transcript_27674/g.92000  ORF Transcript_27674/g.92000 Transcript_27674/m.92000 type:complete len:330 (+) Transcript_27674:1412-2401(+)
MELSILITGPTETCARQVGGLSHLRICRMPQQGDRGLTAGSEEPRTSLLARARVPAAPRRLGGLRTGVPGQALDLRRGRGEQDLLHAVPGDIVREVCGIVSDLVNTLTELPGLGGNLNSDAAVPTLAHQFLEDATLCLAEHFLLVQLAHHVVDLIRLGDHEGDMSVEGCELVECLLRDRRLPLHLSQKAHGAEDAIQTVDQQLKGHGKGLPSVLALHTVLGHLGGGHDHAVLEHLEVIAKHVHSHRSTGQHVQGLGLIVERQRIPAPEQWVELVRQPLAKPVNLELRGRRLPLHGSAIEPRIGAVGAVHAGQGVLEDGQVREAGGGSQE